MKVERMAARSPHWLERHLGPPITLKEANLLCWGLFLALLLPAGYSAMRMQVQSGHPVLDTDFVNFYAMGRILNDYPAGELYDAGLQERIRSEIHPLRSGRYAPVPYPPFVGMLFQPLARMPYTRAYLLWLAISLALYTAGMAMVSARVFPGERLRQSLILCLALCFFPFTIETLVNGQLSTVGFAAVAAAFLLEDSERPFASGLALSLCAYKPTLLLLLIPMLLVSRRFRVVAGVFTGAAALSLGATAAAGTGVWAGYFGLLWSFGRASAGVGEGSMLNLSKYLDLVSFTALLPGGRSWPAVAIAVGCALWAAIALARAWWWAAGAGRHGMRLVWSATLTWTLLLNVYVPIYDSILVALSATIAAGVWKDAGEQRSRRVLNLLWPAIFAGGWVTVPLAKAWHIQILTVLLAALGVFQLRALRRTAARP